MTLTADQPSPDLPEPGPDERAVIVRCRSTPADWPREPSHAT